MTDEVKRYVRKAEHALYTGITRCKKAVIIIGTKKALAIAIRKYKPQMRHTRLKEREWTEDYKNFSMELPGTTETFGDRPYCLGGLAAT